MRGINPGITLLIALAVVGAALAPLPSAAEEKSTNPLFVTVLGGEYSGSQLLEIPIGLDLKESYIFGVSVSKQFAQWTRYIRWEGELQTLKHFGEQDHWEFTGSVNLRWV